MATMTLKAIQFLIFLSALILKLRVTTSYPAYAETKNELNCIRFAPDFEPTCPEFRIVTSASKRLLCKVQNCPKHSQLVFLSLLLMCGDIEYNPEPPNCLYHCGYCSRLVPDDCDCIECSRCEKWTHWSCSHLSLEDFCTADNRTWYCSSCLMEELPLFPQPPTKVLSVHKLKPKPNGLFVIHINIRSLLAHLDEIHHLLSSLKPDILGISETWLNDSVDGEIHFPDYNIFRSDRNRHGGGITTFVRNCLQVTSLSNISVPASLSPHCESLWLNVKSPSITYNLVFGCCYRPPRAPTSSLTVTFNFLEVLLSNYRNVIIAGDFNINLLKSNNKTTATSMRDFITTHSLTQPITLPTRVAPSSSTLLDIFLTIYT